MKSSVPDIRKHDLLMLSVLAVTIPVTKTSKQELGCVLLITTWRMVLRSKVCHNYAHWTFQLKSHTEYHVKYLSGLCSTRINISQPLHFSGAVTDSKTPCPFPPNWSFHTIKHHWDFSGGCHLLKKKILSDILVSSDFQRVPFYIKNIYWSFSLQFQLTKGSEGEC
jgi:hypothetical protein